MLNTIVYYPVSHIYHLPSLDHPENPNRVIRTINFLREKDYEIKGISDLATEDDLLIVHKKEYVYDIMEKEFNLDADTPVYKKTYNYALNAVETAIECAMKAKKGYLCFALVRPPGHHAGYNFGGGFCYFNNISISVFREFLYRNVIILDLDVHHGNGTEDIVERFSEGNIIYVSLHQKDIYPFSGYEHKKYSLNFPLEPYTSFNKYFKTLKFALTLAESKLKDIEVLALSMGFDTYIDDPLANLYLNMEDYYKIGKYLGEYIGKNNLIFYMVLEGGYSYELPLLVYNFIKGIEDGYRSVS